MGTEQPSIELPRYECHKKVWALKIARVDQGPVGTGTAVLVWEDARYAPMTVTDAWYAKQITSTNRGIAGGYWVRYEDGYESFSPADAFESGYTLIER